MDENLANDILKILDRFNSDDDEVESVRERMQKILSDIEDIEDQASNMVKKNISNAIVDAENGRCLEKYKNLIDNIWVWTRIASAAITCEQKSTAIWIFDNVWGVRDECLVKVAIDQDHEKFQWMKKDNMDKVINSLIHYKDDVTPIKFIIDEFKPKHPFNPYCMNNYASYAILNGHIGIAVYFFDNYSEYFKIDTMVIACLKYYQIDCLLCLWSKYPETVQMTQKYIENVMDFNTFGNDEWIAMVTFLKQNGYNLSSLKNTFTATHNYHIKTRNKVIDLLN